MKTRRKKIIALILVPVSLQILFACKMQVSEEPATDSPAENTIRLSDAQMKLANITVSDVREGSIGRRLSLTGVLKVNEQSAVTISSRVNGRIEKLFFRNTGEKVNKGDKLYELFSDDFITAQREYLTFQSNNYNFTGKYEPSLAVENKLMIM
jgi:multidrug efflux pump subunit AcrA (membrane-fusion protein)